MTTWRQEPHRHPSTDAPPSVASQKAYGKPGPVDRSLVVPEPTPAAVEPPETPTTDPMP